MEQISIGQDDLYDVISYIYGMSPKKMSNRPSLFLRVRDDRLSKCLTMFLVSFKLGKYHCTTLDIRLYIRYERLFYSPFLEKMNNAVAWLEILYRTTCSYWNHMHECCICGVLAMIT